MPKKTTIANLIVMPLIASAVLLSSSSALAANSIRITPSEISSASSKEDLSSTKRGIVGTVVGISSNVIAVQSLENATYTVDASHATVMKESVEPDTNPALVGLEDIHVGDVVMVRGVVANIEFN